jgi:hypothetical protein
MNLLREFLTWLSGKKGSLAAIVGAINAYAAVKGYIGEPEVILIASVSLVLFGTASYVTGKIVYNK